MVADQDHYSVTLIVWCMKLKLKIYMNILVRIEKCLISEIILVSQNIMMIRTNKWLAKWKMNQVVSLLKNVLD